LLPAEERHAARIDQDLRQFKIAQMLDDNGAIQTARYDRRLRQEGITVRMTIGMIVATFCVVGRHKLLHDDRDFEPIVFHLGLQLF
jgi:hypothetical protein